MRDAISDVVEGTRLNVGTGATMRACNCALTLFSSDSSRSIVFACSVTIEHNLMTSDDIASVPFSSFTTADGDTAPIMLPNMSIPLAGGFIVAFAIDSNRGLFIDDNGRGVFGWAPYFR